MDFFDYLSFYENPGFQTFADNPDASVEEFFLIKKGEQDEKTFNYFFTISIFGLFICG